MLGFIRNAWHSIQYVYYLRFALLLWLAMPIVASTDSPWKRSPLLHAIFTPGSIGQFIACTFFAVSNAWVGLLIARIVCLNGGVRFHSPVRVPHWIRNWLGEQSEQKAGRVLLLAQVPNLYLVFRLHQNAAVDQVSVAASGQDFIAMAIGGLIAAMFWYLVNVAYYWTFPFQVFRHSARTLLFPRWAFMLGAFIPPPRAVEDDIECCGKIHDIAAGVLEKLFNLFGRLGPGYRDEPMGPLWEGHRLMVLGFLSYLGVYGMLFPITAPVELRTGSIVSMFLAALLFAALAAIVGGVRFQGFARTRRFQKAIVGILVFVAVLLCSVGVLYWSAIGSSRLQHYWWYPPFQNFPVLASSSVLLAFLTVGLAGLAFYLDRFSFPVITSLLVISLIVHSAVSDGGEHYFAAFPITGSYHPLGTPKDLLDQRCRYQEQCPLIVVTATGGGMHAATWTARVLAEIEKQLAAAPDLGQSVRDLHDNLLFASTVSGGSMGMAAFLREYKQGSGPIFDGRLDPNGATEYQNRMEAETACSALEGVAWGLEYSDALHLLIPFLPVAGKFDRSQSLERATARNYRRSDCADVLVGGHARIDENRQHFAEDDAVFTLARLQPRQDRSPRFPAFAFNTTAVETGGRFLLANYRNSEHCESGVVPAESFLHFHPGFDLSLSTAARLSATYPYVSSASRIDPREVNGPALHFVDGGYYDNDGTATLIEFLASAFLEDTDASTCGEGLEISPQPPRFTGSRIRVLVIEIRDNSDLDSRQSPEMRYLQQQPCCSWGLVNQLGAPPEAFWKTGHGSITRRNRRELRLLEDALSPHVTFSHVVFPFDQDAPLSWRLTPREIRDIEGEIGDAKIGAALNAVQRWARQSAPAR